jgi:Cu/Ag efflux protein CusF
MIMKTKLLVSLLVAAMLMVGVGVAAAAPAAAPTQIDRPNVITGQVKSISGTTLTIARGQGPELQVVTDTQTRFLAKDNANLTLADVQVGDQITARGQWQNGQLLAKQVLLMPDRAGGMVTSISGTTLALTKLDGSALSVATTATTKFQTKDTPNAQLSDIKVGDLIEAVGTLNGSTLIAIRVGFRTPIEKTGPFAPGKISAVDSDSLTLNIGFGRDLTVNVSSSTFIVKRDGQGGQVIQLSDLTVGENVLVIGVRSSDGTPIDAKTIIAGKQANPQGGQVKPGAAPAAPRA